MVFKRIKQKFSKSPSTEQKPVPDPVVTTKNNEVPSGQYGLFPVKESKSDPEGPRHFPVDIIAIHGLGGKVFSTWTHSNGTMWLDTLLSQDLPGSRIFAYGYPGSAFHNPSYAGVREFAIRLLSDIKDVQSRAEVSLHIIVVIDSSMSHLFITDVLFQDRRPIIFICHSMGGIVCKQVCLYFFFGGGGRQLS